MIQILSLCTTPAPSSVDTLVCARGHLSISSNARSGTLLCPDNAEPTRLHARELGREQAR
jgi:hypothetical protein